MAVRTTFQSLTDLKNDNIVVIPADLLQSLLESNKKQQDAINHLSNTMEKFVTEFSNAAKEHERLRSQLCSSLETIAENIGKQTTAPSDTFQRDLLTKLKKSAGRRKTLLSKTLRAENLTQYYTELIDRDDPFVPRMFRTKVSKSTPEFEKPIHKELAITKVSNEINLMVERVENWKIQLQNLESNISITASSLDESKRTDFYFRLSKDEEKIKRDRTESFEKIRQSYEEEMRSYDKELFLLTFEKEQRTRARHTKTYRSYSRYNRWSRDHHDNGRWKNDESFRQN